MFFVQLFIVVFLVLSAFSEKLERVGVIESVTEDPSSLSKYPDFQDDEDVVLASVQNRWKSGFRFASARLKGDLSFVISVLQKNEHDMKFVNLEKLSSEKEVFLIYLSGLLSFSDPNYVENCSDDLKNDKDFAMAAVVLNQKVLKYFTPEIREDEEVAISALSKGSDCIEFFGEGIRADLSMMLKACEKHGKCLDFVSDDLKQNKEIVLSAIRNGWLNWHGNGIKVDLPKIFLDDKEVLIESVRNRPCVIIELEEKYQNDKDIVLAAYETELRDQKMYCPGYSDYTWGRTEIGKGRFPIFYAKKLRKDDKFVAQVIRMHGLSLAEVDPKLRNNRKIVMEAINQDWRAFKYASVDIKLDEEIKSFLGTCREFDFESHEKTEKREKKMKELESKVRDLERKLEDCGKGEKMFD